MARLFDEDVKTREVLDWEGVHLLHFSGSSCSQKTRIFMNLKGIPWTSHPVDLAAQQNYTPWFLGINPRGLVPVLVHDGVVHIESNDILTYLDEIFPETELIPSDLREESIDWLREEDGLHLDLRALTMRFVVPKLFAAKKPQSLSIYEKTAGTVEGLPDPHKEVELKFWRDYSREGISDAQARASVGRFEKIYTLLETRLRDQPYVMGEALSLVDIAWFIYTHRLSAAGYPFEGLHPALHRWYLGLLAREEFSQEVRTPLAIAWLTRGLHAVQVLRGSTLVQVVGL